MRNPSSSATVPGHSPRNAVVIDDEPGMRYVIGRWLEDSGYTVLKAPGGAEGLRIVEEQASLELVVTDIVMPGISGQDVFDVLAEYRPDVIVVGMSAFPAPAPDASATRPAMPILTKPFSSEQLLARVRETQSRIADLRPNPDEEMLDQTTTVKTDLVAAAGALVEARRVATSRPAVRHPLCPACGSKRVATIRYGVSSPEVLQGYAAGRVVLGGVREAAGAAHWQCVECGRRWGATPIRVATPPADDSSS